MGVKLLILNLGLLLFCLFCVVVLLWLGRNQDVRFDDMARNPDRRNPEVAKAMGWEPLRDDGWTARSYKQPDDNIQAGEPSADQMVAWLAEQGVTLTEALELAVLATRDRSLTSDVRHPGGAE